MQLPFNTRSQGSAHGRACEVDEHTHTELRRSKNLHDQSEGPGDMQSVGD